MSTQQGGSVSEPKLTAEQVARELQRVADYVGGVTAGLLRGHIAALEAEIARKAAIWTVTTPGEPEQCIAALKAAGAQGPAAERDAISRSSGLLQDAINRLQDERDQFAAQLREAELLRGRFFLAMNKEEGLRIKAQAQLEIARDKLIRLSGMKDGEQAWWVRDEAQHALAQLSDPAAALREHDKGVAQQCAEIADICALPGSWTAAHAIATHIRREFGLEA